MNRRGLVLCVSSGLLGMGLYIALLPSPPRLFDEAQLGESVYQVSLKEPLGYLRVESERDAVSAELELRLQSESRRVSQQITFTLSAMDGEALRSITTPYALTWRQLTTERGAWWMNEPSQLSEGVWLIRPDQLSREHEERSRWCLWRSVTQSSESWGDSPPSQRFTSAQLNALLGETADSLRAQDFTQHSCQVTRPLPESLWPWLTSLSSVDSSPSPDELNEVSAGSLLTFSAMSGRVRERPVTVVERLGLIADQMTSLESSSSLEIASPETGSRSRLIRWGLSDDQRSGEVEWERSPHGVYLFKRWRVVTGQVVRTVERARWTGWPSAQHATVTSEIHIRGSAPWRIASRVRFKLSAAARPLSTARQAVISEAVTSERRANSLSSNRLKSYRLTTRRQEVPESFDQRFSVSALTTLDPSLQTLYQSINQTLKLSPVVKSERAPLELSRALAAWVYERIEFKPHAGLPDPHLALKRGFGDCNERSAALVMLLRGLGLRAEMVFGLIRLRGERWGWHAWVRVATPNAESAHATGDETQSADQSSLQWYEIDPSAPQREVGPEYIAFSAGDLGAQDNLLSLLGQVSGRVSAWSR